MPSIVRRRHGPSALLSLVSSFSHLSKGTEFESYKDPQWRFLLSGEEIVGFVVQDEVDEGDAKETENGNADDQPLSGCVLKVNLDKDTSGYGMVLVSPSQRGKGLARVLLECAFKPETEQSETRSVLAVCSKLGQPVYRKMGFKDVGMVTTISCTASDLLQTTQELPSAYDSNECSEENQKLLFELDEKATGFNRENRLKVLFNGYSEGSCATVAFASSNDNNSTPNAAAVARQDCAGGQLMIGPILGPEECCIALMQALIHKHFDSKWGTDRGDVKDIGVMVMISDHPDLAKRLLEIEGTKMLWDGPAMSSDGKPVYLNGDGSLLALLHPTLG